MDMTERSPKYGLFDFFETGTVEVALISDVVWDENGPPSDLQSVITEGTILTLKWSNLKKGQRGKAKKSAKKTATCDYKARLLKANDDEKVLRQLANDIDAGRIDLADVKTIDVDSKGRGMRTKYRKLQDSDSSEEESAKTSNIAEAAGKTAGKIRQQRSADILKRLKEQRRQLSSDSDGSESSADQPAKKSQNADDASSVEMEALEAAHRQKSLGRLRVKVMQLKMENQQLKRELQGAKTALSTMKYLPEVANFLKRTFPAGIPQSSNVTSPVVPTPSMSSRPSTSQPCSTPPPLPATSQQPSTSRASSLAQLPSIYQTPSRPPPIQREPDTDMRASSGASHALVSDAALGRCNKTAPQKFVNDILAAAYSEEFMACHSLGGTSSKPSSKSPLPGGDVMQVIDLVTAVFPGETASRVRSYIRQKINNADKGNKRKLAKSAAPAPADD